MLLFKSKVAYPAESFPCACGVDMKDYVLWVGSKWGKFHLRGQSLVDSPASL